MKEISEVRKNPTRIAPIKKYRIDDFRKEKKELFTGVASGCGWIRYITFSTKSSEGLSRVLFPISFRKKSSFKGLSFSIMLQR
jgi:hypothetical protein